MTKYYIIILSLAVLTGVYILKAKKLVKIKSKKTQSKETLGRVKEIKLLKSWDITRSNMGRYFIVEAKCPVTQEIRLYKSDSFYNVSGNLAFPFLDNEKKLLDRIHKYIKIGDKIKIKISIEDVDDYYMENIPKSRIFGKPFGNG